MVVKLSLLKFHFSAYFNSYSRCLLAGKLHFACVCVLQIIGITATEQVKIKVISFKRDREQVVDNLAAIKQKIISCENMPLSSERRKTRQGKQYDSKRITNPVVKE